MSTKKVKESKTPAGRGVARLIDPDTAPEAPPVVDDQYSSPPPAKAPDASWHPTPQIKNQLREHRHLCRMAAKETKMFVLSRKEDLEQLNKLETDELSPTANFMVLELATVFTDVLQAKLVCVITYEFQHPLADNKPAK